MLKPIALVGAAFSIGGAHTGSRRGPDFYRRHAPNPYSSENWHGIVWQDSTTLGTFPDNALAIRRSCQRLAHKVHKLQHGYLPIVIGGDHSCAIATWHGMTQDKPTIGLLWIDAHFDSHTPDTSRSQRIHGMPLAVLLGEGDKTLLLQQRAVLNSDYTVVFGAHSFEAGEPELLARHGVRYYTMTEIHQRGLTVCLNEAWRKVAACPQGFGVSIDLDALDPSFAPAVSVSEKHGLSLPLLLKALAKQNKRRLKAIELVEFNPYLEHNKRTLRALTTLIVSLTS